MLPFGDTILIWRLERGFTQSALARKAHIPRPNLSAIETGRHEVSLKTIRALACALETTPGTLVDGTPPGDGKRKIITREGMERVARAVVRGTSSRDAEERSIIQRVAIITRSRRHASKMEKISNGTSQRRTDRAWLILRATYPVTVIESLVQRVLEHQERHQ